MRGRARERQTEREREGGGRNGHKLVTTYIMPRAVYICIVGKNIRRKDGPVIGGRKCGYGEPDPLVN